KRKEYFPVYFVEPYKNNEIALGFDDASAPDRLETLEIARKTGEIHATGRITLVQETKSQFGFIVFAPIYRKGALINSDQARWDNLAGCVLGVFRIGDIVEKSLNYLKPEGVDLFIYDASEPDQERFLYTHSSRLRKTLLSNKDHPDTDVINSKMLDVAGRKWTVICSATPDFIAARSSWRPWGFLLGGVAFTGLVAGFQFIVGHAEHLEKFAQNLSDVNTKLAHEIMERKQAEEALKKNEAFIRNILESVGEGFIVVDREYRIQSANRAFCEFVKMPAAEIVGRHCYEVSHYMDRPCFEVGEQCAVRQMLETGAPQLVTHLHTTKAGGKQYVEIKAYPITDASGAVVSAIETINDVTERKVIEDQFRQAQKMEAVGHLAGGIAHDFNNMLTAIMGYGSLLNSRLGKDSELRPFVDQILSSAGKSANLTRQLLAFSRKQEIAPQETDLNELIKGMEKLSLRLIGEDIELKTQLTDKPLTVMVDPGQIEQVLMNLSTNARDSMPDGGLLSIGTDAVELDESYIKGHDMEKPGKYALMSLTDTGKGMDEKTQQKIFEPFFTTKELGKGTGLG